MDDLWFLWGRGDNLSSSGWGSLVLDSTSTWSNAGERTSSGEEAWNREDDSLSTDDVPPFVWLEGFTSAFRVRTLESLLGALVLYWSLGGAV